MYYKVTALVTKKYIIYLRVTALVTVKYIIQEFNIYHKKINNDILERQHLSQQKYIILESYSINYNKINNT